ncbi:MAG: inositol monophosphatase, partial [Limnothrix sp. RL_2_0]|nr:inositol monophosphatase [Limnothrix sp. RL_2_0]
GEENQWDDFTQQIPDLFWVVDPIDGTVNYSRQIPLFGITIALISHHKPIVAGIAFPALGDRHTAIKGQGAWLNGQKIQVSKTQNIREAIIGIGDFSVGNNSSQKNAIAHALIQHYAGQCLRIRMLGTAALQLAWLATGKLDMSITLSNKSWDVQAGVLLVQEAGGLVFDEDGTKHNLKSCRTLATNAYLKTHLLDFFS